MIPKDEWVTVERAQVEWIAEIMRGRFESEGIEAVLRGNKASGTAGAVNQLNISWNNPLGGVEVRVRREDEARAREILAECNNEESPRRTMSYRTTPQWMQWGASLWVSSLVFYCVLGVSENITVSFVAAIAAFGAILTLGKRRLP